MKKEMMLIVLFLLFANTAEGIGISPDAVRIQFEPHFEKTYKFSTQRSDSTRVIFEGSLKEFITLERDNIKVDGTFEVKVKLPDSIQTPGDNIVFVTLIEGAGDAMVSGVASIRSAIVIKVAYPGIYAQASLNAPDVNINETTTFQVRIDNLGKNDIEDAKASIDVINIDNQIAEQLYTEQKSVKSNTIEYLNVIFNASRHTAGNYRAIAHLSYADVKKDLEDPFRIGDLVVKLVDYTKEFSNDEIVRFDIQIESGWNSKINNVFATVNIFNNSKQISSFQTVSVNLEPWEKKTLSPYWSKDGIGPAEYDVEINLFYEGISSRYKGKVRVVEPQKAAQVAYSYFTLTNLLILLIIILVSINAFFVIRRLRKKEDKE